MIMLWKRHFRVNCPRTFWMGRGQCPRHFPALRRPCLLLHYCYALPMQSIYSAIAMISRKYASAGSAVAYHLCYIRLSCEAVRHETTDYSMALYHWVSKTCGEFIASEISCRQSEKHFRSVLVCRQAVGTIALETVTDLRIGHIGHGLAQSFLWRLN